MVDKLDAFYIIRQLGVHPPVAFPETIITGFGFIKPMFIQFHENAIEYSEINLSDVKCIGVCWNGNKSPCFMIKIESRSAPCNNTQIIDITRRNTVYQQYIHSNPNGKYRLSWSNSNIISIIACESKKIILCTRKKINRLPNNLYKKIKSQLQFCIKILNKALHFSHGAEVKHIVLDFAFSIDLYCLGIHHFECSPIFSLHKIQSFPSLLTKVESLEGLKKDNKQTILKTRYRSVDKIEDNEDYLSKIKGLNKQMRVIMND